MLLIISNNSYYPIMQALFAYEMKFCLLSLLLLFLEVNSQSQPQGYYSSPPSYGNIDPSGYRDRRYEGCELIETLLFSSFICS